MKQRLVDFSDPILSAAPFILLKDRTTGKNIIWATEPPPELGAGFTDEITLEQIKKCPPVPLVLKRLDEQKQRTKAKAEVFTPSWVCEKMIDMGEENGAMPDMKKEPIKYIHSTALEITCGEAPYLVSRYDTVTGEIIPIHQRIGLLDRKLRVINENVTTYKTWIQWVYRAFESVYGYEYQGDNLLIARINLLETFCEYTRDRWHEEPNKTSLNRIADIISWNLWQMDGIYGVIPYEGVVYVQEEEEESHQMTLFEIYGIAGEAEPEPEEELPETIDCKIYDWDENKIITYKSMREE